MNSTAENFKVIREALDEIIGWMCDRELCGHFTRNEIEGAVNKALPALAELEAESRYTVEEVMVVDRILHGYPQPTTDIRSAAIKARLEATP